MKQTIKFPSDIHLIDHIAQESGQWTGGIHRHFEHFSSFGLFFSKAISQSARQPLTHTVQPPTCGFLQALFCQCLPVGQNRKKAVEWKDYLTYHGADDAYELRIVHLYIRRVSATPRLEEQPPAGS